MPGTVRIWWHDGTKIDARRNNTPVVNEPELGYESLAVSTTPSASGEAPKDAAFALIESDVDVRYRVRPNGVGVDADQTCKPLPMTGKLVDFVAVEPGGTISFVEM